MCVPRGEWILLEGPEDICSTNRPWVGPVQITDERTKRVHVAGVPRQLFVQPLTYSVRTLSQVVALSWSRVVQYVHDR